MRILSRASGSLRAAERRRQFCALALLPALVAAAAAMHAPAAAAPLGELRVQGVYLGHGYEAVRYSARRDADAWPRRAGRRYAGARRRGHRVHATRRARYRVVTARALRQGPRRLRFASRRTVARSTIVQPKVDAIPLTERSLVAMHPLAPDPIGTAADHSFTGGLVHGAGGDAPHCKGAAEHASAFALMLASFKRNFQVSEPVMVGGAWPHCRGATHPQSSWRLASLGPTLPEPGLGPSALEPGWGIHWRASASCLAGPLRAVLDRVAAEFGPLTVNSTCRSPQHNARVGGAPRSYHLTGKAVDFRVHSQFGEVLAFLKRIRTVGGVSHYGNGVFHIDTGPRRSWGPNSWGRNRIRVRTARRRA
jgi:Peptidase M15